jgi:hypothetical protein
LSYKPRYRPQPEAVAAVATVEQIAPEQVAPIASTHLEQVAAIDVALAPLVQDDQVEITLALGPQIENIKPVAAAASASDNVASLRPLNLRPLSAKGVRIPRYRAAGSLDTPNYRPKN